MSMPRWFFYLVLILPLLINSSCSSEENEGLQAKSTRSPSSSRPKQQERLQLQRLDFNDGLAKALAEDKPIFLEFYTDWCVYCKKFQRETMKDQDVIRMLSKNFIYIRLNAETSNNQITYRGKSMSNLELSRSFGITSFPSLTFLDSGGQPITLIPGFVPAPQFSAILDYIHQECYQTKISFHDFVKKGSCN
jgi:thioredoxin-related protein